MHFIQSYHQAPLEQKTKAFTAFTTFSGVYEFTLLPKRAPSFQQIKATTVLVGLIYMMFEMYIDDCIVFADTNDEFVSRLDSVLGRFRKDILFLNTSKCSLSFQELELVGKVVSDAG